MTTFGSDYVFPLGGQARQVFMFLHLRRRCAIRRKHDQRNVTVISRGSNLSCALRKCLGLAYNRIKKLRLRPQGRNTSASQPGCTKTDESGNETSDAQPRK